MLVVLSTGRTRSSSERLRKSFSDISDRCKSAEKYTVGKPWTDEQLQAAQSDIARGTKAVRAIPSKNAKALMNMNETTMSTYHGQTETSPGPKQLSEME